MSKIACWHRLRGGELIFIIAGLLIQSACLKTTTRTVENRGPYTTPITVPETQDSKLPISVSEALEVAQNASDISSSANSSFDTIAPVLSSFLMPTNASTLLVAGITWVASDAGGIAGYFLSENASAPASGASGWSAIPPKEYRFSYAGSHTLYAWVKDTAGNISVSKSAKVMIVLPAQVSFDDSGDSGDSGIQRHDESGDDWRLFAKTAERTGYSPQRVTPPLVSRWVTYPETSKYDAYPVHLGVPHFQDPGDRPEDARLRSVGGTLFGQATHLSANDGYGYGKRGLFWDAYTGVPTGRILAGIFNTFKNGFTYYGASLSTDGLSTYGASEHYSAIEYSDQFQSFGFPRPCNYMRTGPREVTIVNGVFFNSSSQGFGDSYSHGGVYFQGAEQSYLDSSGMFCTGAGTFDTVTDSALWSHPLSSSNNIFTITSGVFLEFYNKWAKVEASPKVVGLHAFDAASGKPLWTIPNVGYASGANGYAYFGDLSGNNVHKVDVKTGTVLWTTPVGIGPMMVDADEGSFPVIGENTVVFNGNTKLVGVDKNSGVVKWTFNLLAQASSLALAKDILYFTNLRQAALPLSLPYAPIVKNGDLAAINVDTGAVLMTMNGDFTNVIVANKMLFVVRQRGSDNTTKYIEAFSGQEPTPRINQNEEMLRAKPDVPVLFDASGSLVAPGTSIVSCTWAFSDGVKLSGQRVTRHFPVDSVLRYYTATVTVTDSRGLSSSKSIRVEVPPEVQSKELARSHERFYTELVRDGNGTLILFHSDIVNGLSYQTSNDKGNTWSTPKSIGGRLMNPSAFVDPVTNDIYLGVRNIETTPPQYWLYRMIYGGGSTWTVDNGRFVGNSLLNARSRELSPERYRFTNVMLDKDGILWFFYSVGGLTAYTTNIDMSVRWRSSRDRGLTWSAENVIEPAIVQQEYYPKPHHYDAFLWNGSPALVFSKVSASFDISEFSVMYWNGATFVDISPKFGSARTAKHSTYLHNESRSIFSIMAHPFNQSLSLIYKDMAQLDLQIKDSSVTNNWQRVNRKVNPTHKTMPGDLYPFLSSDGYFDYLVYGEWVRRGDNGYHLNMAARVRDPVKGWSDSTYLIAGDAAVNIKPITLKNVSGMNYLPIVWQEKTPANEYLLKYKSLWPGEMSNRPTVKVQQTGVKSGSSVTYSVQYKNVGEAAAKSVLIKAFVPVGSTYYPGSATGGGLIDSDTVVWNIPQLQPGQSGSFSFVVVPKTSTIQSLISSSEVAYSDDGGLKYGPFQNNISKVILQSAPPLMSNMVSSFSLGALVGSYKLTVSWKTDRPTTGKLEYGGMTYGYTKEDNNLSTFHSITITLYAKNSPFATTLIAPGAFTPMPGDVVYYRITSGDVDAISSQSAPFTVALPPSKPPAAVITLFNGTTVLNGDVAIPIGTKIRISFAGSVDPDNAINQLQCQYDLGNGKGIVSPFLRTYTGVYDPYTGANTTRTNCINARFSYDEPVFLKAGIYNASFWIVDSWGIKSNIVTRKITVK